MNTKRDNSLPCATVGYSIIRTPRDLIRGGMLQDLISNSATYQFLRNAQTACYFGFRCSEAIYAQLDTLIEAHSRPMAIAHDLFSKIVRDREKAADTRDWEHELLVSIVGKAYDELDFLGKLKENLELALADNEEARKDESDEGFQAEDEDDVDGRLYVSIHKVEIRILNLRLIIRLAEDGITAMESGKEMKIQSVFAKPDSITR